MQPEADKLPEGYSIRSLAEVEFLPLFHAHRSLLFSETIDFSLQEALSMEEWAAQQELQKTMTAKQSLYLGVFCHDAFVGWSFGEQTDDETFYMTNSALFSNHRRKGLYRALMKRTVTEASVRGFQMVTSRHVITNNAVLIAKLKFGFVITGFDLSDRFGCLVKLTYFFNPLRKRIMQFRSGEMKPDREIRHLLKI